MHKIANQINYNIANILQQPFVAYFKVFQMLYTCTTMMASLTVEMLQKLQYSLKYK